jgi:hypothetical protein
VSANVEGFREQLSRRPELIGEQDFLIAARHHLIPLIATMQALVGAEQRHGAERASAASVRRALGARAQSASASAARAQEEGVEAEKVAQAAYNDAARLGRWANGLERRAFDLAVQEAERGRIQAEGALKAADESVMVAKGAAARDRRRSTELKRDARPRR